MNHPDLPPTEVLRSTKAPTVRTAPLAVSMAAVLFAIATFPLQASVITDPTLYSVIDPPGSRAITMNATGSTAKSTLESLEGFGVVQDFVGFTAGSNIISFTDPLRSDLRISFSGAINAQTGEALSNSSFATSGTSAVRVASSNIAAAHSLTGLIDFGTWDGISFDPSTKPVSALGFTLAAPSTNLGRLNSITAQFLGVDNSVLSTQTISGVNVSENQGFYFGYSTGGPMTIGSVQFDISVNSNAVSTQALILGLDDIGFTAIPEPSMSLLVITGGLALFLLCRRRASCGRVWG